MERAGAGGGQCWRIGFLSVGGKGTTCVEWDQLPLFVRQLKELDDADDDDRDDDSGGPVEEAEDDESFSPQETQAVLSLPGPRLEEAPADGAL